MPLMVSVSGVRGIVGSEVNPEVIGRWASAFASILPEGPIVLGRDSRITGGILAQAAGAFLASTGRTVLDVGIVPTPTVQLAVENWNGAGGLILSASHNPSEWNALKFVDTDGSFLSPDRFLELKAAFEANAPSFRDAFNYGDFIDRHEDALNEHLASVLSFIDVAAIRARNLKVALECGHGAGGTILPRLAEELNVDLQLFHGEPNGQLLPNPEPTTATLIDLLKQVEGSTAFLAMTDPDADRCGLGLPGTDIVGEEWTLPLVIRHRLKTGRGPIVTNLSTSTRIEAAAKDFDVPVYRTPVGEAHVVSEMKQKDALIGGEGNGGVIDPRSHLGRDSVVAFAILCEAESVHDGGLRALAQEFPPRIMLKDKRLVSENNLGDWSAPLETEWGPADDRRDGLRWAFEDGFLHVRASNTEPIVRIAVEAETETIAAERMERTRTALGSI